MHCLLTRIIQNGVEHRGMREQIMTMANATTTGRDFTGRPTAPAIHPLSLILLLAATLRLPLAFWPNFHHPDEIFQYLEPAWRLLGHDGVVSWEWRYGMRGWLLPATMAGPVALGDWLVPGGNGSFVLPRLVAAISSLSIVVSAWAFGDRVSRTHAIVAAGVTAIWFELVYFAPHTLSEPLATAMIVPAALLLTRPAPAWPELIAAGALLALAGLFRFQYAPAIATLAIGACWHQPSRLLPTMAGGLAVLAVDALIEAGCGAMPFAWLVENVRQNLLHHRAAEFGDLSAEAYVNCLMSMWSVAAAPLLLALVSGWRRAPLLLAVAVVNIAVHSLIGHKEYRFILLSIVLIVIVAALGSAEWIKMLRKSPNWRRLAVPLVAGGWILTSATLAITGAMPEYWRRGVGASNLAADVRNDPQMCGLALDDTSYFLLAGRDRLAGAVPLFAFYKSDPLASGDLAAAVTKAAPAFNRVLAFKVRERQLPPDFVPQQCAEVGGAEVCVYARSGDCHAEAATPFSINDVLVRIDR
jgi:GPI mannosyltransferase 3